MEKVYLKTKKGDSLTHLPEKTVKISIRFLILINSPNFAKKFFPRIFIRAAGESET